MNTQKTIGDRILRLPEVKERTGLGRTSIYLREKMQDFPTRIVLGSRSVGWLESEVDAWIQTKVEERNKDYSRTSSMNTLVNPSNKGLDGGKNNE